MKIRTIFLVISLITLILFGLFSLLIYPKINYYEPISFKIHSTNPEITKNISFNAITPLGRNIPLTYDSTIKTFSLDYSFVKHLNLSINQKTFVEITLTG